MCVFPLFYQMTKDLARKIIIKVYISEHIKSKIISDHDQKIPQSPLQTKPRHHEAEPQNTNSHKSPGR